MKKGMVSFIIIFNLCPYSFSLDLTPSIEVLEPPIPELENYIGMGPSIYRLKCDQKYLNVNYMSIDENVMLTHISYTLWLIDGSMLVQYEINDNSWSDFIALYDSYQHENLDDEWYQHPCDCLIHDASSVTIDGEKIILENAYYDYEFTVGYSFVSSFLDKACLSIDKKYIIGIANSRAGTYDVHNYAEHSILHIWDSKTGEMISGLDQDVGVGYKNIFFSPQKNYLLAKFFNYHYSDDPRHIVIEIGGSETRFYPPQTFIIDLSKLKILDSKRDVAFTADEKFFVTERNGAPTLVLAKEDVDLLQYSMPYPMISAAFSPDDKHVYIAGDDNKIYVFESGVASGCENWEVME